MFDKHSKNKLLEKQKAILMHRTKQKLSKFLILPHNIKQPNRNKISIIHNNNQNSRQYCNNRFIQKINSKASHSNKQNIKYKYRNNKIIKIISKSKELHQNKLHIDNLHIRNNTDIQGNNMQNNTSNRQSSTNNNNNNPKIYKYKPSSKYNKMNPTIQKLLIKSHQLIQLNYMKQKLIIKKYSSLLFNKFKPIHSRLTQKMFKFMCSKKQ